MNRPFAVPLAFSILLGGAPGFAGPPPQANFPDASSLAAEMRRLEHQPGSPSLPPVFHVKTLDGNFAIPTESTPGWLAQRAAQLEQYSRLVRVTSDAAPALHRILARPEFNVRVSHRWWDTYRDRFNAWSANLLRDLFAFIRRSPIGGSVVFWGALVGAAALLAFWLLTVLRSGSTALRLNGFAHRSSRVIVQDWIGAMNRARQAGDFREAIHCAYWAAIARLQSSGGLPAGSARTPREYLRQVAPGVEDRPVRALTGSLEKFWYGGVKATNADISACLVSLEELGWRIE